ncbi:hypothetical protein [Microbacterium sp. NPDC096154]|uniref:hypothetical protein n=1 Tax=Microbacterium sp. NPDC096154 TaxID=3155549 RepID=UPI003322C0DF
MHDVTELAELRRRAYGPHADLDAAGFARLQALEEAARGEAARGQAAPGAAPSAHGAPAVAGVVGVPATPRPADEPHAVAAGEGVQAAAVPDEGREPSGTDGRTTPWRWAVAGLTAGALLAGGLATVLALSAPGGRGMDQIRLEVVSEDREAVDWAPRDARLHASYESIDVRSWDQGEGQRCLGIGVLNRPRDYVNAFCVPDPLTPILDVFVVGSGLGGGYPFTSESMGGLPDGTVIRLELVGDVVHVSIAEPVQPTPTA